MAKIVKTAALVIGAVALVATGIGALAAPALAGTVTVAGVSTGTLLGVSAGLGVVGTLLTKKPNMPANDPNKWKADPFAGIPYVVGRTMTAGNIVYRRTHGNKNKYETFGTILSGAGPVQSIDTFFANRTTVRFGAGGAAIGDYNGLLWQRQQLGQCPEPDALVPPVAGAPGWTAASKLSGYAATLMTLSFDSKGKTTFTSEPTPAWILHGVKVYDPRLDSTYPGGAGACRALDETTYVWSENPFLHALTWCLGRWQNGKRVMGLGAPLALIDIAAFVEGAAIADAAGWKIGGVVYSRPDTPWNNLKLMLQAGSAVPVAVGGTISCVVDAPRVSLATITDGDIVGECSLAATASRRARINGVVPRFRSEAHDWTVVPAELVQVAEYVEQDGGERTKEVEFTLVQHVKQASTLAAYQIANARELGPGTFPLKPIWMNYRIGDCVTISTREIASMKVLILERSVDPQSGVVTYTVRSETDAKHPFALGQVGAAPPTASLPDYNPVDTAPDPASWVLSASMLTSSSSSVPALVISGSVEDGNTQAVIFDFRVYSAEADEDENWIGAGLEANTITRKEITGITAGTPYEASIRYRAQSGDGDRLILGPVTVPAAVPMAENVTADLSSNPPKVLWQMPQITGWSYAVVFRGTTSNPSASVAVSDHETGGLYEPKVFEDDVLTPGTYWWWVRIYDAADNLLSISPAASGTII